MNYRSNTLVAASHEPLLTNVLQFLESHQGVTNIVFDDRLPLSTSSSNSGSIKEFQAWERANHPCVLPADLKAFYTLSDGFHLKWSLKLRDEVLPIGSLYINSIAHLRKFKVPSFRIFGKNYSPSEEADSDDEDVYSTSSSSHSSSSSSSSFPQAFDLDMTCADGHVALLYTSPSECGIYFQDLSGSFYFLASSFHDYYRLLLMHMGIAQWQYAFTNQGLTENSKIVFSFLSPQRLNIDLAQGRSNQLQWKKQQIMNSTIVNAPPTSRSHHKHHAKKDSGSTHPNGLSSLQMSGCNLSKIEEMAQSILSLQQAPIPSVAALPKTSSVASKSVPHRKKPSHSELDHAEEEE